METLQRLLENQAMGIFGEKLKAHLEGIGMTPYRLSKLSKVSEPSISNFINGVRPVTSKAIIKFSSVAELGLSENTLKAWRAIDLHGDEVIYEAFKALDPTRVASLMEKLK